ncbi:hypothetical protein PRZ48_012528 [Zasmidium cellare]|uniref:Uncharacterized protein n=1 Tax=Zasmidium cellare TaxID=395010 RepID=A0ABR0E539_ZASCE|nr:hypothetical protein PRZ48_012528 [Zasmidium cellare]
MPSHDSTKSTGRQPTPRKIRRLRQKVQRQKVDRQPLVYGTKNYHDNVRRLRELEEHLKKDVDDKMP